MKKENILWIGIIVLLIIISIVVIFKENTYKVTFAVDNEVYTEMDVRKNTSIKELPKPEKEGYAFIGWYDEEGNILETTTKITQNIVYYARWATIVTEED